MTQPLILLGAIAALALTGCGGGTYHAPSPYAQRPIHPLVSPTRATVSAAPSAQATVGHAAYRAPAPHTDSQPLRVMSFNLRTPFLLDGLNHWGFRKDITAETIQRFAPDILGTQECTDEQAMYLQAVLGRYGFAGAGRDDGKRKGEMAAIFWRTDRFTKVDDGHFWLSETPDRAGSKGWDAGWRRVCTWVKLRERATGRVVAVFNTHFDVWGDAARYHSAHLLRERIATIAAGLPTLVTGDFNCPEGSPPYHALVGDALLDDTYRDAHPVGRPGEGTRHGFDGRGGDERIDWILATAGFDTLGAGIDRSRFGSRYPSDHFPVTAVLRFNDHEAAILRSVAAREASGLSTNGG